jgi:hypothetical protein
MIPQDKNSVVKKYYSLILFMKSFLEEEVHKTGSPFQLVGCSKHKPSIWAGTIVNSTHLLYAVIDPLQLRSFGDQCSIKL